MRHARSVALLVSAIVIPLSVATFQSPDALAQSKRRAPSATPSSSSAASRDDRIERAKQLFSSAEEKLGAKDFAGALEGYRAANALIKSPQAFYRIAMCLDELGSKAEALEAYHRFLGLPPPASMSDEKRVAEARIADADKGTLRLTTKQAGVQVDVDGGTPVSVPVDLRLAPGRHTVRATAPGYEVGLQTYEVKTGETFELQIALAPIPPPIAPPPPTVVESPPARPEPARPTRRVAYATWGAAAVSAGVGAYFGLRALAAKRDFDRTPTEDLADRNRESAAVADVGLGLAAVLAITGGVFYAYSADSGVGLRVSPAASAASRGAAVQLTW